MREVPSQIALGRAPLGQVALDQPADVDLLVEFYRSLSGRPEVISDDAAEQWQVAALRVCPARPRRISSSAKRHRYAAHA